MDLTNSGVCNPGGGALCSAQAGALKALYEFYSIRGAKPRAVRGASGGDLNSPIFVQAFADGGESIVTMEEMWKTISHRKVHTLIPHLYPRSTGLFKLGPLKKMLRERLDVTKLVHSGIDYAVKATRYGTAPEVELRPQDDYFFDMLVASASYPFMFKPQKIAGAYYGDAGINDNVPMARLIHAGCDTIFLARPTPRVSKQTLKHTDVRMFRLIFRVLGELMDAQLNAQVSEIAQINRLIGAGFMPDKRKIRIIELEPSVSHDLGVMEFNAKKCAKAFDDSYRAARRTLSGLV